MVSNALKAAFSTFNGFAPPAPHPDMPGGGPRWLPVDFDFSSVSSLDINLTLENEQNIIGYVQSAYINNSNNANDLTLVVHGAGQILNIGAGNWGMYPILATNPARFTLSCTPDATATGQIIFGNVPMPYTENGPVTVNANVAAIATGVFTDGSGTVTVGGTSQQIFAANANRLGLLISNPPNEIEPIYINFGAAATVGAGSIALLPGEKFETWSALSTQAVNITAATTAHPFTAKELA